MFSRTVEAILCHAPWGMNIGSLKEIPLLFAWDIQSGQPLIPGVKRLTAGSHYNYTCHGHTLIVSAAKMRSTEIDQFEAGEVDFALFVHERIVFMLACVGSRPWFASHYNWWINPPHLRPDPVNDLQTKSTAIKLHVCLADARTGIVASINEFALSPDFGGALLEAVAGQVRHGLDPWRHLALAKSVLSRSTDLGWMLKEALCVQFRKADAKRTSQANGEVGLRPPPGRHCASVQ